MLVFYNSKEKVFIDYFEGNTCFTLRESDDAMQEKYVASGARMHYRIGENKTIKMNNDFPGIYSAKESQLRLPGLNIYFLQKKVDNFYGIKPSSFVYVVDDVIPEDLQSKFMPAKVFIGTRTRYKTKKEWSEFCKSRHVECIDLRDKSYTLNLNTNE